MEEGNKMNKIWFSDNLEVLQQTPDASVDLIYIDPPFNTGYNQSKVTIKTIRDAKGGDRTGFGGRKYRTEKVSQLTYQDTFHDYEDFIMPRLTEAFRILKPTGSIYFHIDYRENYRVRIMLDEVFGIENFQNEIIWAYDYGGRPKKRWAAKHDTIYWYSKNPNDYYFSFDEVDRIPYMAPSLVGKEKTARGKIPTDVWWNTIVPTNGKEKTGYPTQKPLGILNRIVRTSCPIGGTVMDFFAGSGSTGAAAIQSGRKFLLVDENPEAIFVMKSRFSNCEDIVFIEKSSDLLAAS